jgi:hypothetical protein
MLTPAQTLLCKSQRDTLTRISCPDAARSLDSCACAYKSGNPFGCAQSARLTANALVGTATPYGESSALGRVSLRRRLANPEGYRERPSPDATFYPARRRSAYNGAAAFRGKLPPKTCLGNPRKALLWAQKWHMRETLPQHWFHRPQHWLLCLNIKMYFEIHSTEVEASLFKSTLIYREATRSWGFPP